MADDIAGVIESQNRVIAALAAMNRTQLLHGEMLRRILAILEEPAPEQSPLTGYMERVVSLLADLMEQVARVLNIPVEDSRLSDLLFDLQDRLQAIHNRLPAPT
jgi:hypothetical protein